MKAVVAAFNEEEALVGAFSVIVQLHRLIDLRHYQAQAGSACCLCTGLVSMSIIVATVTARQINIMDSSRLAD